MQILVDPYVSTPSYVYKIKASAKLVLPDRTLIKDTFADITIVISDLLAYINGGNRLLGFTSKLIVTGDSGDPDIRDPLLRKVDLAYSWDCIDIVGKIPC